MEKQREQDFLDRLVIFLAKRDGIDKLVKTLQYTGKLSHWHLSRRSKRSSVPNLATRAKALEVSCGLARKAFRLGRWLSGLNNLRAPAPNLPFLALAILANAGEMVYFFFDHFTWLSRIGVLDPSLAPRFSLVSASGEAFGYVFFVIADAILIAQGVREERRLALELQAMVRSRDTKLGDESSKLGGQIQAKRVAIAAIRVKRVMSAMAIAANVADFVIALADIEPNPFVTHAVTLGISGLVSAWAGWYRNWPSS
ncbi:peroxisomal membrane protein 11-4 [Selaginella moellendorffii]|uniref:peroxisomal membrane protein 11-4 n=1 Tax=Selaginella moellendorffii TaxID=88036 RepID=UPI000D1D0F60|nr:peroxisomal membrane protein 11-4 [Selaginella moellendorffii]|eukprot:XP_024523747.1 peroxisomal membrane protein 11-4 [Selaginella moellendorffii]